MISHRIFARRGEVEVMVSGKCQRPFNTCSVCICEVARASERHFGAHLIKQSPEAGTAQLSINKAVKHYSAQVCCLGQPGS